MRWISISYLVFFLMNALPVEARTRAPKTENERSLLYWRYLCENQSQTETVKASDHTPNSPIELSCPSQNWKVLANGDEVREVVEDAKK